MTCLESACMRRRIFCNSRQFSIACLRAWYCSLDKATDTVLPLTLRVHW